MGLWCKEPDVPHPMAARKKIAALVLTVNDLNGKIFLTVKTVKIIKLVKVAAEFNLNDLNALNDLNGRIFLTVKNIKRIKLIKVAAEYNLNDLNDLNALNARNDLNGNFF